jgi:hypothetical protein
MYIGFYIAGQITESFKLDVGHDWPQIWMYPAGIAAVVMILFAIVFKEKKIVKE